MPRPQAALMIALAVAIALAQVVYYFGPYNDRFQHEVRAHVRYDVEDALLRSREFPPGTEVHILAENVLPEPDANRFANYLGNGLIVHVDDPAELTANDLLALPRARTQVFFVIEGDVKIVSLLTSIYGPAPFERSPYPVPENKALLRFVVPAQPLTAPPAGAPQAAPTPAG